MEQHGYDALIVGAGSAGCVLAARLSEDPTRSVLLLEAGPDYPIHDLPPQIKNGWEVAYEPDWGFVTEPDPNTGRSINAWRGKLVGGCSATNAAIALRGHPQDYDHWASLGNSGWSWQDVLPFFQRVEDVLAIRRYAASDLAPLQHGFLQAATALGYEHLEDHNAPGAVGVGSLPTNTRADGLRLSAALTYLNPAIRTRKNLHIRADVLVDRLSLTRNRCQGVITQAGEHIQADSVILSAGAYGSPAILLRSGIGPAEELTKLNIIVQHDLPQVGRNLVDHPISAIDLPAHPDIPPGPKYQTMLTARSSTADKNGPPDFHIFPAGPFNGEGYSPTGAVQALVLSIVKPQSRGWLRLRSANPSDAPRIHLAHLEHPDDLSRMLELVDRARELASHPAMQPVIAGAELFPGHTEDLAGALKARVETYHHPVGTCAMGEVVDAEARVRGIDDLRVVDASITPAIPSVNTNLPTMMIAERIAALLTN